MSAYSIVPIERRRALTGSVLNVMLAVLASLAVLAIAAYFYFDRAPLVSVPPVTEKNLAIEDIRVIDVVSGDAREHVDVLIENGRIASITPHNKAIPNGATLVDGRGLSLIPGLIDAHCHIETASTPAWTLRLPPVDENLERLLYSGVTRFFDPGSRVPAIFKLRDALRQGDRLGPRLYAAGALFTAPGGHPEPMLRQLVPAFLANRLLKASTRQIATDAEAADAIEALSSYAPDFIKIVIDSLPPSAPQLETQVTKAIVREAENKNLRVVAHIGTTADALRAAQVGVKAWLHGVYKERIPDESIAELAAFGIPMMPTMTVFRNYADVSERAFEPTALEREVVSADVLKSYNSPPDDFVVDPEMEELLKLFVAQKSIAIENVRRLHQAGVEILAGSDSQNNVIHGPALHRELALLSRAGLSPLEVLRAATLNNARFLSGIKNPSFGIVEEGKVADLVLIRGNPLEDVAAISRIEKVILGGVMIIRHPLPGI